MIFGLVPNPFYSRAKGGGRKRGNTESNRRNFFYAVRTYFCPVWLYQHWAIAAPLRCLRGSLPQPFFPSVLVVATIAESMAPLSPKQKKLLTTVCGAPAHPSGGEMVVAVSAAAICLTNG